MKQRGRETSCSHLSLTYSLRQRQGKRPNQTSIEMQCSRDAPQNHSSRHGRESCAGITTAADPHSMAGVTLRWRPCTDSLTVLAGVVAAARGLVKRSGLHLRAGSRCGSARRIGFAGLLQSDRDPKFGPNRCSSICNAPRHLFHQAAAPDRMRSPERLVREELWAQVLCRFRDL